MALGKREDKAQKIFDNIVGPASNQVGDKPKKKKKSKAEQKLHFEETRRV